MKKRCVALLTVVMLVVCLIGCGAIREEIVAAVEESKTVDISALVFPEGWEIDETESDETTFTYAPGGDIASAGCMIQISEEYIGTDAVTKAVYSNPETIGGICRKTFENRGASNITLEEYGETLIGSTSVMTMEFVEDDIVTEMIAYFSYEGGYFYMVSAADVFDTTARDIAEAVIAKD